MMLPITFCAVTPSMDIFTSLCSNLDSIKNLAWSANGSSTSTVPSLFIAGLLIPEITQTYLKHILLLHIDIILNTPVNMTVACMNDGIKNTRIVDPSLICSTTAT